MLEIAYVKLTPDAIEPTKAHPNDAGWDLYAARDVPIQHGKVSLIQTGIVAAIPQGCCGLICDRSSHGSKGLKVMGGVIDAGYRGEIVVALAYVAGDNTFDLQFVAKGAKVAQLLILPVPLATWRQAESLDDELQAYDRTRADRTAGLDPDVILDDLDPTRTRKDEPCPATPRPRSLSTT